MDTKSKKWSIRIGFFSFALAVSLLMTGVLGVMSYARWVPLSKGEIGAFLKNDYQETESFRSYVSGRLYRFLNMACGTFRADVYENDETVYWADETEVALEEGNFAADVAAGEYGVGYNIDSSYAAIPQEGIGGSGTVLYSEKEQKELADYYHGRMEWDKNMYYSVSYQGKELYTNMEGLDWNGSADFMPPGYNFYLCFDGEKVTIRKGVETPDVYGDGVYREESGDWYVPGYANIRSEKAWEDAEIVILVAEQPLLYSGANRGSYSWSENYDSYYLWKNFVQNRKKLMASAVCLAAGLFFLICYLILRRQKQEADARIAAFTGRIIFEVKVLLLLVFPGLLLLSLMRGYWGTAYDTAVLTEAGVYGEYFWENGFLSLYGLSEKPWHVLFSFWLLYLFVNDIRKNQAVYRHGLAAKLIAVTDAKALKLSLSARQTKRFCVVMIITAILFVGSLLHLGVFVANAYQFSNVSTWIVLSLGGIVRTILLALLLAVEYWYQKKNMRMMSDLDKLSAQIRTIKSGNYHTKNDVSPADSELAVLAEDLNDIQSGMETALSERIKSERMKVELVANVSHDIKTPLTSIVSYIELLKQEEELPDYVKDYVKILEQKADRLKDMVQDVFSVSKAASGQLEVNREQIDFAKLVRQTLADMQEKIEGSRVQLKVELPEQVILIVADGNRMYRVIQNLLDNVLKYSLDGSRAYLTLTGGEKHATLTIKNISNQELNGAIDFTERFVRGDESRTDGGSGLGLSIAKSFTEACGGQFAMKTDADLFTVTIVFERVEKSMEDADK